MPPCVDYVLFSKWRPRCDECPEGAIGLVTDRKLSQQRRWATFEDIRLGLATLDGAAHALKPEDAAALRQTALKWFSAASVELDGARLKVDTVGRYDPVTATVKPGRQSSLLSAGDLIALAEYWCGTPIPGAWPVPRPAQDDIDAAYQELAAGDF